MMCIVPPAGRPSGVDDLKRVVSTPSWNFVDIPTSALTHIQKMAPGPPITRAMATPAMLPIPTVAATTDARACTEDICEPAWRDCLLRSSRSASGRRRTDTIPE